MTDIDNFLDLPVETIPDTPTQETTDTATEPPKKKYKGKLLTDYPPEVLKEMQRKGGRATAEKKRKAKCMKEAARYLLEAPLLDDEATAAALAELGLEPDQQSAILLQAIKQARKGDMESARFARDTSGQSPAQQVEVGGIDGKPIETIDWASLTDDQLMALAGGSLS